MHSGELLLHGPSVCWEPPSSRGRCSSEGLTCRVQLWRHLLQHLTASSRSPGGPGGPQPLSETAPRLLNTSTRPQTDEDNTELHLQRNQKTSPSKMLQIGCSLSGSGGQGGHLARRPTSAPTFSLLTEGSLVSPQTSFFNRSHEDQ